MSKDTISDILTCIRNAHMANKETVRIGFTNIVEKIVQILLREGFIKNAREDGENPKTLLFFKEPQSDEDSEWDSDSDSDDDDDRNTPRRRIPPPRMLYVNPCPLCRTFKRLAEIAILIYLWVRSWYRRRK